MHLLLGLTLLTSTPTTLQTLVGDTRFDDLPEVKHLLSQNINEKFESLFFLNIGGRGLFGGDSIWMNTAIAGSKEPLLMAEAMRAGVEAGRIAYLAERIPMKAYGSASSPLTGVVRELG